MTRHNIYKIKYFRLLLIALMITISNASCDNLKKELPIIFKIQKCEKVSKLVSFINKEKRSCKFCEDKDDLIILNNKTSLKQISTGMKIVGGEREDNFELIIVKTFKFDLNRDGVNEIFISQHNPYLSIPQLKLHPVG